MKPIRALVLAEAANPEWTSVPLLGWSHSRALGRRIETHLVTHVRNEEALSRAGLRAEEFTAIDSQRVSRPLWRLGELLRGGSGKGWTTVTALHALGYYYFEILAWRRFRARLAAGEFDVVHRITPQTPTRPSLLARRCARLGVPFVLGPLNGGLAWPPQFAEVRRREREWLSYLRGGYRLLPAVRSTWSASAAILVGSRDTLEQVPPGHRSRAVYLPENGVEQERFNLQREGPVRLPLRIAFVGRVVPFKGPDMLLEACARLARQGRVEVDILGDGPERKNLLAWIEREGLQERMRLPGFVDHRELQRKLVECDVFAFPSIREFGGGVVIEAMALGLPAVVVDYGGPPEFIAPGTGVVLPMGTRAEIVTRLETTLETFTQDPQAVREMGQRARNHVLRLHTWDARAAQVIEVYRWVLGRRPDKPDFGMPLRSTPE